MRIFLLDNHDSFTYNLVQMLHEAGASEVEVRKNDACTPTAADNFDAIVISPGPGLPHQAGIACELIRTFSTSKRILGVCLGHQAIATVFGGKLFQPGQILHGEAVQVTQAGQNQPLFAGISQPFQAGLYHSWAVDAASLPPCLQVTATDSRGIIMAMSHDEFDIHGVQFHPESIMTPQGHRLLSNWIKG